MEIDAIEPAVGGPQLILRADIFLQHILLDTDRLARQIAFRDHFVVESVQSMQKPDRERAARSQAGSRRKIGVVMNFQPLLHSEFPENSAHRGMLYIGDGVNQL